MASATCLLNCDVCTHSHWLKGLCFGVPVVFGVGALTYLVMKGKRRCSADCSHKSTDPTTTSEHPRNLIPQICKEFHAKGWMTGSGGAISIKDGDEIFVSPSGVPKERVEGNTLFVCDMNGKHIDGPSDRKMTKSSCAPMFMNAFQKRGAGAVFHIHSQNAVMVTMLFTGKEFRIAQQQMLKVIANGKTGKNYRYDQELVIPIVENENEEIDIKDNIVAAMEEYPETCAVLVRHHGIYLWGDTWQKAKIMCEAYDYIFDTVVRMFNCGLDPTKKTTT